MASPQPPGSEHWGRQPWDCQSPQDAPRHWEESAGEAFDEG